MAGFVDSTVKDIDARLTELRAEVTKLEAARSALTGGNARSAAPAPSPRRRGRGPGRPRGRRGGNTRAVQALELVSNQPGITIPQIAEAMSIEPNYLYRVLPRLVNEGKVRRDGQGWYPAS